MVVQCFMDQNMEATKVKKFPAVLKTGKDQIVLEKKAGALLVGTNLTSMPVSIRRCSSNPAWVAIPPYGGGAGAINMMALYFIFFTACWLKNIG